MYLVFLLVEKRQLHILVRWAANLAARWCITCSLLLITTHTHQKEEAGNNQWDGDGRN